MQHFFRLKFTFLQLLDFLNLAKNSIDFDCARLLLRINGWSKNQFLVVWLVNMASFQKSATIWGVSWVIFCVEDKEEEKSDFTKVNPCCLHILFIKFLHSILDLKYLGYFLTNTFINSYFLHWNFDVKSCFVVFFNEWNEWKKSTIQRFE